MTIVSKGTIASSTISRSIKVIEAIPTLAQYALVYNLANNSSSTYVGSGFNTGRQLGMTATDFSSTTANISAMKTQAQSGGIYLPGSQYKDNPAFGYHIVLKTNNTFDLYVVTAVEASLGDDCTSGGSDQTQWGLWTIDTQEFLQNYPIPANGLVFAEDNVWVDGTVKHSRISIVAAKSPDPGLGSEPNITVNDNLLYTNTDGSDVIGLISQGNINIGYGSGDVQTVDGALLSQNGRVGRYHYVSDCGSSYDRTTLNIFGMIATNQRYGFAYNDGTGYMNRNLTYDANLFYNPPPFFPEISSYYSTLSWQEI